MARHTCKFWKTAIEMEKKRSEIICQSIKLYKEGFEKRYGTYEGKD